MIRHNFVGRIAVPKERRRIKGDSLTKIIILIVTGCGLIYQTAIIFQQFMSGKTVVRLEIGNNQEQRPPAITICYPGLFSMERTANISENFTKNFENYTKLLKNNSKDADHYYWSIFDPYTFDKLKNNGLDLKLLFDKMSVKYKNLDGQNTLLLNLYGDMDYKTLPGEFSIAITKADKMFVVMGDPLESMVIMQNGDKLKTVNCVKCLTFFSYTQEKWRNFHAQLGRIKIYFNQKAIEKSFVPDPYYYISIHSPNHLPKMDVGVSFKLINIEEINIIKYSELKIQRLGMGYDTDCHSYEAESNYGYYRMRSDCVNDCYQDKSKKFCNAHGGILMSYSLIREDTLVNGSERLISCPDPGYNEDNFTIWRNCRKMCKLECNMKYYSIEIERLGLGQKFTVIRHGEYPDIFVEHIPEINFMGFVCNFGGLLGMWLGLSLFAIFNNTINLITMKLYRKNTTNIFNIRRDNLVK